MLELIEQLERRAGSASLVFQRPRPHDWQLTVFRDASEIGRVVYLSYHGDTLSDVVRDALDDAQADLRIAA